MSSRAYLERWWVPGDPLPSTRSQGSWTKQPMFALKDDHVAHCACQDDEGWDGSGRSARWSPELMAYWEAA